jgi:hypothetical protein
MFMYEYFIEYLNVENKRIFLINLKYECNYHCEDGNSFRFKM